MENAVLLLGKDNLTEECRKNKLHKIENLKEVILKRGLSTKVEADGGIKKTNIRRLINAGLDIAVVGTAIGLKKLDLRADNPKRRKRLEEQKKRV